MPDTKWTVPSALASKVTSPEAARAAAAAVAECRVIAQLVRESAHPGPIEAKLLELEHAYTKRAEELTAAKGEG